MENNNLEKEYWGKSFYGSKLNTVLLLILIVLMIFALRFMYQNQEQYVPDLHADNKLQDYSAFYENSSFSFKYDPKVQIIKLDNPVYGNELDYFWIGIGPEKYLTYDKRYDVEIEYTAGGEDIGNSPALPLNIKLEQKQKFGDNVFSVYLNTDQYSKTRVFQMYKNSHTLSIAIPDTEDVPKYIDMSSIVFK